MASADEVKNTTGFTIGGVSPIGHVNKINVYIDKSLKRFDNLYAAAGHPNCVFKIDFEKLQKITNGLINDILTFVAVSDIAHGHVTGNALGHYGDSSLITSGEVVRAIDDNVEPVARECDGAGASNITARSRDQSGAASFGHGLLPEFGYELWRSF